jgi:hypothetical protein
MRTIVVAGLVGGAFVLGLFCAQPLESAIRYLVFGEEETWITTGDIQFGQCAAVGVTQSGYDPPGPAGGIIPDTQVRIRRHGPFNIITAEIGLNVEHGQKLPLRPLTTNEKAHAQNRWTCLWP